MIPPYVQDIIAKLDCTYVSPGGMQRGKGKWYSFLVQNLYHQYPDPEKAIVILNDKIGDIVYVTYCRAGDVLELGV
jgi:hypothetical protein